MYNLKLRLLVKRLEELHVTRCESENIEFARFVLRICLSKVKIPDSSNLCNQQLSTVWVCRGSSESTSDLVSRQSWAGDLKNLLLHASCAHTPDSQRFLRRPRKTIERL
jgi:hypothetical protein